MRCWEYLVLRRREEWEPFVGEAGAGQHRAYVSASMPDGTVRRTDLWTRPVKGDATLHTSLAQFLTELGAQGWELVGSDG